MAVHTTYESTANNTFPPYKKFICLCLKFVNGSTTMAIDIKQKENGDGARRVMIVGAGPVGLFLAYKLGRASIKVIVLEKNDNVSDAPRAVGYYAASALALHDAGLYDKIREEGFMVKGLCWRKKPVDNGNGGKRLGDLIAAQPLVADMTETNIPVGAGLLSLPQGRLTRLFLREALATGNVEVHFQRELRGVEQDQDCTTVTAIAKVLDGSANEEQRFVGEFLVGADGARSATRKLLNLPFPGHTWPERLLATDVTVRNVEDHVYHCHYILDQVNFTVSTPLTEPIMGEKSLWRYTIALDTSDDRPDEEVLTDKHIKELYGRVMAGPRPLEYEIRNRSVYRIHQRLAPTFRRGRAVLAGDAAHVCNVSETSHGDISSHYCN